MKDEQILKTLEQYKPFKSVVTKEGRGFIVSIMKQIKDKGLVCGFKSVCEIKFKNKLSAERLNNKIKGGF